MWDGHGHGLSDVCYDLSGNTAFTAGTDGIIKVWTEFQQSSDPKVIKVGDTIYALIVKGNSVYVASDNNTVDEYSLSDGSRNGVLFRFASNPTSVALSESQNLIAAGSSDFAAKIVDLETNEQKEFVGHKAPVLSVSIDPLDEFLATSSCDGNLCIWNIADLSTVETIGIVKPSNDICNSESLCRMSWRPATGEDLAVPCGNVIKVFSRGIWTLAHSLESPEQNKAFNCCCFSPCGRFLACGTVDGSVCIWDAEIQELLQTVQHNLKSCICSVVWNPKENNTLAIANTKGQVGLLRNAVPAKFTKSAIPDDLDALFENEEGDLHDFFDDDAVESNSNQPEDTKAEPTFQPPDEDIFEDDFEIPSTNKLLAANDDLAPPIIAPLDKLQDDDATSSVSGILDDLPSQQQKQNQTYKGPAPTPMQPAFQPSSTPYHLSHRFMVWNSVGTIRSYTDDTESAIDVQFHDKRHHYSLHFNNESPAGGPYNTMADLSMNAIALAAESIEDTPSKLSVNYYASWEGNKDWNVDMPDDEEIKALTIGESWIAVCTDARLVRMFSLAGMQLSIFSIPGPVLTMAAHTDQLMIVYHASQGFNGNQCLGYMLLEVGLGTGPNRAKKIVGGDPIPLSKKSTLQWLGFSAEGTPTTVDSAGVVRMTNRGFCNSWIPVLYLNKLTKSRYDHYWMIALHENPQDIRAVMCKGSTYPSTVPRPFATILQYKLPLCEAESEKTKLEEEYWRTRLFASHSDFLESHGFETDEKQKHSAKVLMQQTLMKLFALSCKLDKESRALEVSNLLPSSSAVSLAIKYASRLKRVILAQKLGEIAQEKTHEEMQAVLKMHEPQQQVDSDNISDDENADTDDFKRTIEAGVSHTNTQWTEHKSTRVTLTKNEEKKFDTPSISQITQETQSDIDDLPDLMERPSQQISQMSTESTNPFKVIADAITKSSLSQVSTSTETSTVSKPFSGLDSITRKPTAQKLRSAIAKSHSNSKKSRKKDSKKQQKQQTLFEATSKSHLTSTPKGKINPKTSSKDQSNINDQILKDIRNECTSGVMLYVSEAKHALADENPDLDTMEVRKMAISNFKKLSPEEREVWNERAKDGTGDKMAGNAKRKLQDDEDVEEVENVPLIENDQQPSKMRKTDVESKAMAPSAKLAAFAYEGADA